MRNFFPLPCVPRLYALSLLVHQTVNTTPTKDDEDDLGGSGGSGGGAGGSGEGPTLPIEVPAVRFGNMTGRDAYNRSTNESPYIQHDYHSTATKCVSDYTDTDVKCVPEYAGSDATTGHHIRWFQTTETTPTLPAPTGPVTVAQPMPSYPYICTVSEPVRKNQGYLPTDGMCDFLFYDSLYKNFRSSLLNGINSMESNPQYVVYQAARYSKTKFGLSFSPENGLFTDYKEPGFLNTIDEIWGKRVSNYGFLNLYRQFTHPGIVAEALAVLKALYEFLEPNFSTRRPSYYVVGMTPDSTANDEIIHLLKTVFTPSLFIAVSHLSYPVRSFSDCLIFPAAMETLPPNLTRGKDYTYGHTVNESLALLWQVEKMGISIPLAISFSLKGVYYAPKFANPASPTLDEFQMFKPCQDHQEPFYEDPKMLCSQGNWTPKLPLLAYNMGEKRTISYLTEATITQLLIWQSSLQLRRERKQEEEEVVESMKRFCVSHYLQL
ncbi:hypothetical protein MTO96_002429 [Rhipicephalus appendiculatus]